MSTQHFLLLNMKKERKNKQNKKHLRFPIRLKAIVMIVALAIVIVEVSVAYYSVVMNRVNRENYMAIADSISGTVAQVVNVEDVKYIKNEIKTRVDASPTHPIYGESSEEEFNAYIEQFEYLQEDSTFNKTRDYLRKLVKSNISSVDCIYLSYIDKTNSLFVYLVDSAEVEDACSPGLLDPIFDVNKETIDNPSRGFPAYMTDTKEYGYLCTSGAPIYDGDEVVGFAMVDISMTKVRAQQADSIVRLFLYLLITIVLIGAAGILWVSLWMIRPLKRLTETAESYDDKDPKATHERFEQLDAKSNDEIGDLTRTIKKMEKDVYDRFNQLLETNRQLITSREQEKKLSILANQDGLTGVHNKISYNAEVERINTEIKNKEKVRFAVVMIDLNYLKETNDTYGHDTGDVALIKLASIICDTFNLSPVYRVGGDEFVVLCRGKDLAKITLLVGHFKKEIEKSSKDSKVHDGEHISAAIGYSVFDIDKDTTVDQVFKRADREMYENKREMKKQK